MDNLQELRAELTSEPPRGETLHAQAGCYILELSQDWIVRRASENAHHLLGQSHVTLIDEPLGRFVHSQALHDLRNLFSRLSGTTGIGRAYGVRLTNEPELFDIAFQLSDGRVLLEAVPAAGRYGEAFGTVGGLIAGLADNHGQSLLDGGARRMRALTGYDRATLVLGQRRAESSRGAFGRPSQSPAGLPALVADVEAEAIAVFPRGGEDSAARAALLRAPSDEVLTALRDGGVRSSMRIPFEAEGMTGEFRCDSRTPRQPSFELHAAAELFAQLFALRMKIDELRSD